MSRLDDIRQERPDIGELIDQGAEAMAERILELEKELGDARQSRSPIGDSRTTHAPPSSDPRPKTRSQRRKSGKPSGGQKGHPGHRLKPVENPDAIEHHAVTSCPHCQNNLTDIPAESTTAHQVFDLPKTPLFITEHRMEKKTCPSCSHSHTAPPPPGAEQPTQYGPRLAALAVYLNVGHFIPLDRCTHIIKTITGHGVSQGWIVNVKTRISDRLETFMDTVTEGLRSAKAICCDETGFRFAKKRYWLHVCCTALLTLLICHRRRGCEAIDTANILPGFEGVAVHDQWSPYFNYDSCLHSVCNEHIIRELDGVIKRDEKATWAESMKQVLWDGLNLKKTYHGHEKPIPPTAIKSLTARYKRCLKKGYASTPEPPKKKKSRRGKQARGKTLSLLDRLRDRREETLRFLHNSHVPWSNNQAERDIRMMKVQQKVSGGFRSEKGAIEFCRIRSYLSTSAKNDMDMFHVISMALSGNPWVPDLNSVDPESSALGPE